jgi:hypothetical protein
MSLRIYTPHFNWLPRQSSWDQVQSWHARQQDLRSNFEGNMSVAVSSFSRTSTNQFSGMATITARRALSRVQAQLQAKIAAASNSLSGGLNIVA